MSHCKNCGGLIGEPGKIYMYAGKWCHCEIKQPIEYEQITTFNNLTIKSQPKDYTDRLLKSLKNILNYVETSYDIKCVPAIYKSPAQSLREAADELEKKDRVIEEARELIKELDNND